MAELNIPRAHSPSWYDNLAQMQSGYYYPWNSIVGERNGEDAFIELVREHLRPDMDVLEVGCGHGELALDLAPLCRSITAYDRVQPYIELAEQTRRKRGLTNATFIQYDARDPSLPEIRLPAEANSVDLIIGRRAPLHWIPDARRVCRHGGILIQLNPMEEPIPAWSNKLPHKLHYENSGRHTGSGSIQQSVDNRLHQAGLLLHSGWGFDVPEIFENSHELYSMITWGLPVSEIPDFGEIEYKFKAIFERYAEPKGIVLRHCRYLWKAEVNT